MRVSSRRPGRRTAGLHTQLLETRLRLRARGRVVVVPAVVVQGCLVVVNRSGSVIGQLVAAATGEVCGRSFVVETGGTIEILQRQGDTVQCQIGPAAELGSGAVIVAGGEIGLRIGE